MGRSSKVTRVCAGVAALLLAFACSGCQNAVQEEPSADDMVESALSSAGIDVADVAAVASGRIITQQDVEDAIAAERVRYGFEGDASWNSYLESAGLSEHDVWAVTVKSMVDNALVEAEAERLGIDVSDRVARRVESVASLYPSHAAFIEALADKGYTEESYTDAVSHNLLWDALRDEVVSDPEPTDEQIRQYAEVVAPTLTGRRSSHILFASDDYATALDVLEQIEAGADFATLAAEYSIDSTAADGGDVGWDSLNTFVPAYQQALDELEVGEVSGIVRSSFGYHIIMCTDKYDAPTGEDGAIDIDAIPDDLMDAIVQAMRESLSTQLFDRAHRRLRQGRRPDPPLGRGAVRGRPHQGRRRRRGHGRGAGRGAGRGRSGRLGRQALGCGAVVRRGGRHVDRRRDLRGERPGQGNRAGPGRGIGGRPRGVGGRAPGRRRRWRC